MFFNLHKLSALKMGLNTKDIAPFLSINEKSLFDILKDKFQISEEKILSLIAKENNTTLISRDNLPLDNQYLKDFNIETLKKLRFIPLFQDESGIAIATDTPYHSVTNKELGNPKNTPIQTVYMTSNDLSKKLESLCQNEHNLPTVKNENILFQILHQAVEKKASDIHLNKTPSGYSLNLRIQGTLFPIEKICQEKASQFASLIKLHAHMDISISKYPQDGHLSFPHKNRQWDCRVSSIPTVYGEDFVLRLFQQNDSISSLQELGFLKTMNQTFEEMLNKPSGLILVTGPTGSGKTTTLYACIHYLMNQLNRNVITLEDPIERIIHGCRQSQVNPGIGYTFTNGLRTILRQDPDCIVIGEIRDQETAKIALDAAYTGHLVISSLHTPNCESTLLRLSSFQLDPFLIQNSLKGIISQKLAPMICQNCKKQTTNPQTPFLTEGCKSCYYSGSSQQTIIAETVSISARKKTVELNHSKSFLKQHNYHSFEKDILEKFKLGLLSIETKQYLLQNL